jgi:hypothetical protein
VIRFLRGFIAHRWALPALLLALGAAYRIAWLVAYNTTSIAQGEMPNVAMTFARTGVLADAYRAGQGPTAHVLPIPPIFAGLVYRAFGIRSVLSEAVLAGGALILALASFVLLYRCFSEMGSSRTGRLLGLAIVCLVPLSFYDEVVAFKIWEGQLAVVTGLAVLYALLRLDGRARIGLRAIVAMSLALAFLFFVHPPLGVAAYVCALLCLIDRVPAARWPAGVAIAAVALVVVLAPWTLRNLAVFGEFIPLRSDFGLELALANHPAAAAGVPDDLTVFRDRLAEIHPFASDAAYDAMRRAGGEVAYSRLLAGQAASWIAAHPRDFALLCAKHLAAYFFAPEWLWRVYTDAARASPLRLSLDRALHALGLLGAIVALIRAPRRYRCAVIMLIVPALIYMTMQPILRYRYLMFGLIAFFAADLVGRSLTAWPAARRWLVSIGIEPGSTPLAA